jgi:hypothetical protein
VNEAFTRPPLQHKNAADHLIASALLLACQPK